MTPRPAPQDRGLLAVTRVRAVRERDSRVGVQHALAEQRRREHDEAAWRDRLEAVRPFEAGASGDFVSLRATGAALADALREAGTQTAQAARLSEAARAHWSHDRTRLAAVELLLERRAAARRAERLRVEARELDDLATQRWARDRPEDGAR